MRPYRIAHFVHVCAGALGASLVLASPAVTLKDRAVSAGPGAAWKLVWHDEFSGHTLDASRWSIGLSWISDDGTNRHHNNQYASVIRDEDVAVSNGTLKLYTRRGPFRNPGGRTYEFSEGLIQTHGKFQTTYGYFEARIRIPVDAGPGLWPAFWMLPEGWPPEMDIMEVWTSSNRHHQGLAYRKDDGSVGWDDINHHAPLTPGWHNYGMEWGPGYQVYSIDGRVNKRVFGKHVPDVPMYLLLNSGIESGWKPNASTRFPNAVEVDYLRVYQRDDVPVLHNAGFEESDILPWRVTGRAQVVAYGAKSGRHALRLDAEGSGVEQTIFGLKPSTRYVVQGWARVSEPEDSIRIGVREQGRPESHASVRETRYTPFTFSFTTGTAGTSVVLFCETTGSGSNWLDDLRIETP